MAIAIRTSWFLKAITAVAVALLLHLSGVAQEKLYGNAFPLSDVKLLEGPFQHAQELNIHVLLEYDLDRLIAPFRKEIRSVAGRTRPGRGEGPDVRPTRSSPKPSPRAAAPTE